MPYELKDLVVDRVDLVDEGANSAAFIELYKRKENSNPMTFEEILSKMKPEHASVIQDVIKAKDEALADAQSELQTANDDLAKAKSELETAKAKDDVCPVCGKSGDECTCEGKTEKSASFDEAETLKSMPAAAREMFEKMRAQKEAAEEQIRKAAEEKVEAEAVAKAASLKAIPVEQSKLVGILKGCSPEIVELLEAANGAIEAAVLGEVGKNKGNGAAVSTSKTSDEAWDKLEAKAAEVAKRDNVTKERAMSTVLSENPELYQEYLNGGAN